MEEVTDIFFSPLTETTYVRPFRFNYTQDGRQKTWDLLEVHDSVAILIFNITRRKVVFVKQFRPAVYFNSIDPVDREAEVIDMQKYPASLGVTLEMCAGIVDKDLPLDQIACEEVLEECGYKVQPVDLKRILSYRSGVGVQGAQQTLYYVEVTDDMKVTAGGGVADELIELVELSVADVERMLAAPPAPAPAPPHQPLPSPPSCLFALMWFLHHHADNYRKSFERQCGECKTRRSDARALVPTVTEREDDVPRPPPHPLAHPARASDTSLEQ